MAAIDDNQTVSLATLFTKARTQNGFDSTPITHEQIHELYDLYKWGPTSANCEPARVVFVTSDEAKDRLIPHMSANNQEKTRNAPVVAIIAYDLEFYENLPKLFPHMDARPWFAGNPAFAQESAFRNSSLQGAYLMLAARSLGIDCGPMSGFNADGVNAEFFPDGKWKANFICNLGHGDPAKVLPRLPRLEFDEACKIL
jgi:3-hydroxypropanoate dehydrogenase